jgi:hypothetical protein
MSALAAAPAYAQVYRFTKVAEEGRGDDVLVDPLTKRPLSAEPLDQDG